MTYLSRASCRSSGTTHPPTGRTCGSPPFRLPAGSPRRRKGSRRTESALINSRARHVSGVGVAVDLDVWLGDAKSLRQWDRRRPVGRRLKPDLARNQPCPRPRSRRSSADRLADQGDRHTRTPDTAQAIKDFQRGYLGDPPVKALREDGLVGPKTEEALRSSAANGGRSARRTSRSANLPPPSPAGSAHTGSWCSA